MAAKSTAETQTAGINISGSSQVTVGADMVGGDKISISPQGLSPADLTVLSRQFTQIKRMINNRTVSPDVDQAEIKTTVEKIEAEVTKGDGANPKKVERWLRFLAEMAGDIFEVTVATLAHPAAGVAKAIQLIACKAQEEAASPRWNEKNP